MKLSEKDTKLLIYLVSALLLVAAYFLGFSHFSEKKEEVQVEVDALVVRYKALEQKNNNRAMYEKQTVENKEAAASVASKYPSFVSTEGEIYFTKLMEDATDCKVNQLLYTESEIFYASQDLTAQGDTTTNIDSNTEEEKQPEADKETTGQENATEGNANTLAITGYKTVSTISFESDYSELKNMINYISTYPTRKTIEEFSVSVDKNSGILTGTMAYNNYYITGSSCTYEPYEIPSTGTGVGNVFGQMHEKE